MRATSSSQNEKISFSSLIIFGIVAFTKYSLYPWILVYLHSRTSLSSWGLVVLGYGSLLSTLYFGEYFGQIMANNYCTNLSNGFYSTIFLILSSSYFAVAFVSRFFILLMLFWVIGFSGSILSAFSLNIDSRFPLIHFQRKSVLPEARDPNRQFEWSIICFIFFTLLTSFLYDHRPHVEFPCYYLSLLLAFSCCAMLLYYCILQRTIRVKKSILSAKLTSTSYASYNAFNANSHSMSGGDSDHGAGLQPATESTEVSLTEADLAYAGDVPVNFLNCCSGDITKARQMYAKMIAWRRKFNVDKIFETPQHGFESIARFYPHAIHGYSKDGCGVVYEVLGKGKAKELTESGVSIDDIVWHFNLRNEVVFRYVLAPERLQEAVNKSPPGAIQITPFRSPYSNHPNAMTQPIPRLMTVIDLQGISMSSFSLHVISFLKKSSDTVDNFYPEQVARLVVCNAPTWFSLIWGTIKKVLPDAVQNKVDISYDCSSLDKFIHPSQRPKEYGGTDVALGESEGHKYFLSLAEKWKEKAARKNREEKSSDRIANSMNAATSSSSQPRDQDSRNRNVFSWISNRFRKVPLAYLGEKNTYKFNGHTGKWEMEVSEENTNLAEEEISDEEDGEATPRRHLQLGKAPLLKRHDSLDFAVMRARSVSGDKKDKAHANHHSSLPTPVSISTVNKHPSTDVIVANNAANQNLNISNQLMRKRSKPPKMSKEQLEEHGLVLAIHAAHFASNLSKRTGDQPLSISSNQTLSRSESGAITANLAINNMELGIGRSEPLIGNNGNNQNQSHGTSENEDDQQEETASSSTFFPKAKLSAQIFLFVSFIFIVILCIQSLIWTLLPVWFASPLRSGGLGYNVRDLGLLLSSAGMITLHLHVLFGSKIEFLLKASPVRALRVGCGIFFLSAFTLQIYIRLFTLPIEEALHHLIPITPSSLANGMQYAHQGFSSQSLFSGMMIHQSSHQAADISLLSQDNTHSSLLRGFPNTLETEMKIISHLSGVLPSISILALAVPSILISILVASLYLCRRAAGILFHLALSSSFQSPILIRSALNSVAEVIGPFCSALLYSIMYSTRLRFPLDSSFFLSFSYSMVLIAYMLSLFLTIHFRGDYGLMTDEQEFSSNIHSNYYQQAYSNNVSGGSNSKSGEWFDGKTGLGSNDKKLHQRHSAGLSSGSYDGASLESGRNIVVPSAVQKSGAIKAFLVSSLTEHVLSVPLGDMNLLFSSVGNSYSYGSKLYNLKDDFKDL